MARTMERRWVAVWQTVTPGQAMAQRFTGLCQSGQAATATQLRCDQRRIIIERFKTVILAQIDAIDSVFIEPDFECISDLLRRTNSKKSPFIEAGDLFKRSADGQFGTKASSHITKAAPAFRQGLTDGDGRVELAQVDFCLSVHEAPSTL